MSAVNSENSFERDRVKDPVPIDGFTISSSPHIRSEESIQGIMYSVVIALLPATIGGLYYFGMGALTVILTTVVAALATEVIFQRARRKPITIWDGSALVTGLLLALSLPPGLPLWMAVVGAVVAITLGKQVFGGLGSNPFNPALVGRVFLFISFPVSMTTWLFDGKTVATPLGLWKFEGQVTPYNKLFWGNTGGCIGETSAFLLLVGLAYLLYKKYVDWRVPLSIMGTVALLSLLLGQDPVFHLLTGGLCLGAFFMATDMVTSPITSKGAWIYGIGIGVIVVVIRVYGGYPEGVSFAILLMNALTPLIDRFTRPRVFGT